MKTNAKMDLYTIGKELGHGKFGTTFLCTEIATGHDYACKCISKYGLFSKKERERLQSEIDILKSINLKEHPNIVSIKEILEDDSEVYIVMELCEGGTLFDHCLACGTFEEPKAAKIIKEIVYAIEACHHLGVVHRDLKLENLLFQTKDIDSPLKIIDFGFAQFFKDGEVLTDVVGSKAYIAPEVMEGHHGPKADIWSIGVILYALLVGSFPFKANTFEETYKKILEKNGQFDGIVWLKISEGGKDLIQRMLKYNVSERLSASEVLKHPWIEKNAKQF